MHQKELLCQKNLQWNSYCETSDKLTSQVIERRLEYDEIFKRISDFITWRNSKDGRKANLPKQEESHKEILFADWDARLRHAERAIEDAATKTNHVIKNINENLHSANLVEDSIQGFLPNVKQFEQQWRQATKEKGEAIGQTTRLNWEAYWRHLVKPHIQWMTLRFLTTSTEKMVLALTDAVFTG